MASYDVYTNLSMDKVTDLALETFAKWAAFALGKEALNGKILANPSGKYAKSLRIEEKQNYVAVFADAKEAPEANWIENGRMSTINLQRSMLAGGKVAKDGSKYRVIPIPSEKSHRAIPQPTQLDAIGNAVGLKMPRYQAFARVSGTNFYTMSSKKPEKWHIPPMAAYSPAEILSEWARSKATEQSNA